MLFKFGFFWKTVTAILASWVFYGFVGYEFTMITLLVLLVCIEAKRDTG